jgi:uncharacterized protein (TIGR00725 family)
MTGRATLGIIGPGDGASDEALRSAELLGALAAGEGWIVINGGVASGVMEAASRGAASAGGLVVGILPSSESVPSPALTAAVVTGLGQARNNVIVLSSNAVAVCGMSSGTAAEAALALRAGRPVVFIQASAATRAFFEELDSNHRVQFADSPAQAIALLRVMLERDRGLRQR